MPREMLVACDGSCLKNPGGATGWAWAAEDGRWAAAGQPSGTNQVGELWGLLSLLRDFPDVPLVIQADSQYAIKVATTYRIAWRRNGWKTREGKPISNMNLVLAIDRRLSVRDESVRFVKVPSHTDDDRWPLNAAADKHARGAAIYAKRNDEAHRFDGIDTDIPKRLVRGGNPVVPGSSRAERPKTCQSCDRPILNGLCACSD